MKKNFLLFIVMLCVCMPAYGEPIQDNQPPSSVIISPVDRVEFALGSDIVVNVNATDIDGIIDRVELYVNNRLEQTLLSPPYNFIIPVPSAGRYELKSIAYDDKGAKGISKVVVTVAGQIMQLLNGSDFEDYVGGDALPNGFSGTSTLNSGLFESVEIDEQHGKSFGVSIGTLAGSGPWMGVNGNNNKGEFTLEADIRFTENRTDEGGNSSHTLYLGTRTDKENINNISFNNGTAQFYKSNSIDATKNINYNLNQWYHIRYDFDQSKRQYSFYWNGSSSRHISNYTMRNGVFNTLQSIRFTLTGENSSFIVDNVKLYIKSDAPYIKGLDYITKDGDTVQEPNAAPYNTSQILVKMNVPLNFSSVSKDTVKLMRGTEAVELEKAELSTDGKTITLKPRYNLTTAEQYEVLLTSQVKATNGIYLEEQLTAFDTLPAPLDIIDGVFVQNGMEKQSVAINQGDIINFKAKINNQTNESCKVLVLLILRKEGSLVSIKTNTIDVFDEISWIKSDDIVAEESGLTAEAFVWNSWNERVPLSTKIFK